MNLVEHVPPCIQPQEISVPLPKSLHTTAHVHLTFLEGDDKKRSDNNAPTSVMAFLTATTPGDSGVMAKPMGSFVYAMPDRTNARNTLSTTLYNSPASVEYATRTAKILARRMGVPVYVGCSIDSTALGLVVEEEMEGLKRIVEVIMERWEKRRQAVIKAYQ